MTIMIYQYPRKPNREIDTLCIKFMISERKLPRETSPYDPFHTNPRTYPRLKYERESKEEIKGKLPCFTQYLTETEIYKTF